MAGTLLEHNDVSDLTYGAISVGWGWSRHACATCTNAANNTIRYNRAHDYKQVLNDEVHSLNFEHKRRGLSVTMMLSADAADVKPDTAMLAAASCSARPAAPT